MPFCDNCGFELKPEDLFCPSCGKENVNRGPAKGTGAQPTYSQPPPPQYQQSQPPQYQQPPQQYQPQYQQPGYQPPQYSFNVKRAVEAPFNYRLAPLGDRCVGYLIDYCICSLLSVTYIGGCIYWAIKDGIRNGQSFGSGATNIRVVNFNTGMPASPLESCIRNFCDLCVCVAFIEKNQRHVGDLIAGTIGIKDE